LSDFPGNSLLFFRTFEISRKTWEIPCHSLEVPIFSSISQEDSSKFLLKTSFALAEALPDALASTQNSFKLPHQLPQHLNSRNPSPTPLHLIPLSIPLDVTQDCALQLQSQVFTDAAHAIAQLCCLSRFGYLSKFLRISRGLLWLLEILVQQAGFLDGDLCNASSVSSLIAFALEFSMLISGKA
jgi:hypothetical protein